MNIKKIVKGLEEKYPIIIPARMYFIRAKAYVQRSMSYVSIINSGMILFLFLSQLNESGMEINLQKFGIPIFIVTLFILGILGFLEDMLGFYSAEKQFGSSRDPYISAIKEIQKDIKDIKQKMEEKK